MKYRNLKMKLGAGFMTAAMALTMAGTPAMVFAEGEEAGAGTTEDSSATTDTNAHKIAITKEFDVPAGVTIPTVSFDFDISPIPYYWTKVSDFTTIAGNDDNQGSGSILVYPTNETADVPTGMPKSYSADTDPNKAANADNTALYPTFSAETKFTVSYQNVEKGVTTGQNRTDTKLVKTAEVNLDNLIFTKQGLYLYNVTETVPTQDQTIDGNSYTKGSESTNSNVFTYTKSTGDSTNETATLTYATNNYILLIYVNASNQITEVKMVDPSNGNNKSNVDTNNDEDPNNSTDGYTDVKGNSLVFKNTYTKSSNGHEETGDDGTKTTKSGAFVLSKKVVQGGTGNDYADHDRDFTFTVKMEFPDTVTSANVDSYAKGNNVNFTTKASGHDHNLSALTVSSASSNGIYTYTYKNIPLADTESITWNTLPVGTKITVTEDGVARYTATYKGSVSGSGEQGVATSTETNPIVVAEQTDSTSGGAYEIFTNTFASVGGNTGIIMSILPYIAMLLAAAAIVAVYVAAKKRVARR